MSSSVFGCRVIHLFGVCLSYNRPFVIEEFDTIILFSSIEDDDAHGIHSGFHYYRRFAGIRTSDADVFHLPRGGFFLFYFSLRYVYGTHAEGYESNV